jgi:catechol 2,3-dioxygenase-like lactoylglutathione lyase family enzyme
MQRHIAVALAAYSAFCALPAVALAAGGALKEQPRLEHIVLLVKDLDQTATALSEVLGWRRNPLLYADGDKPPTYGGAKNSWIDGNGIWLELIQPTVAGASRDRLGARDCALAELDFEVDNFKETYNALKSAGVTLVNYANGPVENNGRVSLSVLSPDGGEPGEDYAAMVPVGISQGISVEIFQRGFSEASILRRRDALRSREMREPTAPHIDRVVVLSNEPGKAARFFVDSLHLHGATVSQNSSNMVFETTSDGSLPVRIAVREARDEGASGVMEIAARVENLAVFAERLGKQGIHLVNESGERASAPLRASGRNELYGYIPTQILFGLHGLRLRVYQPLGTSQ